MRNLNYVSLQAKLQKMFHIFVEVLHVKQHNQKMNDSDLTKTHKPLLHKL